MSEKVGAAHGRYQSVYTGNPSVEWDATNRLFHGNGAVNGKYLIVCTKGSEWRMGDFVAKDG